MSDPALLTKPLREMTKPEIAALASDARDRYDLSVVIGPYTTLKKRSRGEMVGLCPFHNERTPSLDVNDAKGTYHCWGCGAGGDAITFLMKIKGLRFSQAIEWLLGAELPQVSPEERAKRKEADARQREARLEIGRSIWENAVDPAGTQAEVYARSRGITAALPPTVRFTMTPRWYDPETGEAGRDYPAMVCALQDMAGEVTAVQCIYLQDGGRQKYARVRDGKKARAKLTWGLLPGSAFRIGPLSDHLVICEGPEDGLTLAQELTSKTVWVSCGTDVMHQIALPADVRSVTLAGDNGAAGARAVAKSRSVYEKQGRAVNQIFPSRGFKDWNDQLMGRPSW